MTRGSLLPWRSEQGRYTLKAYGYLPITCFRRVVFGNDPYWRQYFWSRWGYVPTEVLMARRARPVVWIDALSGGEVTQLVTFCRTLHDALPGWSIVLSTNTSYSYRFARANLAVDGVMDTPWDCRGPVRRALRTLAPQALVCVENLTCPLLVREAARQGVKTFLVSGLMSHDMHLHPMMRRTTELSPYHHLDWIGAKSTEDAQGFAARGARRERVVVTGNMKFDLDYLRVPEEVRRGFLATLQLGPDEPTFLAGSVHPGEEELVADAYLEARKAVPGLRLLLVPRYQAHAAGMIQRLNARGLPCLLKSSLGHGTLVNGHVIVVDTFGELARLYSIASVIFLGGSLYRRNVVGLGQNPIEPLSQRRPLLFGPFMNLWRGITNELKAVWPGVEVTTAKELADGTVAVLSDQTLRERLDQKVESILAQHRDDVANNVRLVAAALASGS
jgi:3-deoxy-D-manno-octulosonic-acid transferase